ncbi:MAG: glycosyltransferase family A protein, partial [Bacteroidota bacterium]
ENTLKSILNQTFTDYEVVLIDDCSTDESVTVIQPYLSDTIRVVSHSKNSGLSAARNTGIRNATAQFVTFLDADDTWEPTILDSFHKMIQQFSGEAIFATNYQEVYPNGLIRLPKNNTSDLKQGEITLITDFFKRNKQQGFFIHSGICFDKKVFETVGFYDETIDFAEDLDFNIRAFNRYNLVFDNSRLVNYTMYSENQLTNTSILGKTLPNYDQYEVLAKENSDLKAYLDFERYVIAKHLKTDGDTSKYKEIVRKINPENLNTKQQLLLKLPVFVLYGIQRIKSYLLRKGIRISSYN